MPGTQQQDGLLVIYADGRLELQNLGTNYAATYFTFEVDPFGGPNIKLPVLKLIRPKSALHSVDSPDARELAQMPDPTRRAKFHA